MIQCAIYNFLLTEIENIKANKIFCIVSLFLIYMWDVKRCTCLVDRTCFYEPINIKYMRICTQMEHVACKLSSKILNFGIFKNLLGLKATFKYEY